jgi:hypothetical protein
MGLCMCDRMHGPVSGLVGWVMSGDGNARSIVDGMG